MLNHFVKPAVRVLLNLCFAAFVTLLVVLVPQLLRAITS